MAILQRLTGKVFAGSALLTNLGVFGSALSGSPTNPTGTNTEAQIQAEDAYEEGWTEAVVTSKNFPPIEEVNGVLRTISYQTCYLLQEGIPTWDADTEYSATSIVKDFNGNQLNFYRSLADGNSGNPITDNTKWTKALIVGEREIGVPQITLDFSSALPDNCIDLMGQEVSQTTYNDLYAIYQGNYNKGNEGAGNFRLPDFSDRAIYGGSTVGYIDAGLPDLELTAESNGYHDHTISIENNGSHKHDKGDMNITSAVSLYNQDVRVEAGTAFFNGTMSSGTGYAIQTTSSLHSGTKAFKFSAARQWTGNTSSNGSHNHTGTIAKNGAHTHSVTSSNAIVGSANSVFTDGVKVRVFTRYK